MSQIVPSYDECLRIFREEIDEHLHWQEAQPYYGLLTRETGWKMPARTVAEEMGKLEDKIPSTRFKSTLQDFNSLYAS